MEILSLLLILLGLVIHRYLTIYDSQGLLPYGLGFRMFLIIFLIGSLANLIWLFGFLFGVLFFLLSIFQIIHMSYLWLFLLPFIKSIEKNQDIPPVNNLIYGLWSFLSVGLIVIFIINIFSSEYMYLINKIRNNYNLTAFILFIVITAILGNILRVKLLDKKLN